MERAEQELGILEQVSQVVSSGLELSQVFQQAMTVLAEHLSVQRASLVLTDPATQTLRTMASIGLTPTEQQRGQYELGEGVTGQVIATGKPAVIPDVSKDKDFLNRTGSRAPSEPISFLCVPIRDGEEYVGAISIDKPASVPDQLEAESRFLKIIARLFSQAIRIHNLVQIEKDQWLQENQELRDNLRSKYQFDNIIGSSPVMLDALGTVGQVATSRATVLLLGETGCGKEMFAKAIHYNSPRRDKPMVRVNCGALSPQLLESELFGHVKGAFTGAIRDKIGRFEAADGGTIFLDEVGTLDPQLQIRLLRVLQEREFERVGDHRTVRVDVRVIAATNLELEEEVRKGNFREDLYYRLNVVTLNLPPLRQRREDIPELIDYFLDRYNRENARSLSRINRDVMNVLLRYPWPGNVRELENAVERCVVLSQGEDLTLDLLPLQIRLFAEQTRTDSADDSMETLCARLAEHAIKQLQAYDGQVYDMVIHEVERQLLQESLEHNQGVKTRTADFLGINRNTLNKKVRDLGLEPVATPSAPTA